jgi:hypothetical protein
LDNKHLQTLPSFKEKNQNLNNAYNGRLTGNPIPDGDKRRFSTALSVGLWSRDRLLGLK